MPAHVAAAVGLEPLARRARIGHGLDGGKGLARDQEQRAGWLDTLEHRGQFMAVDIRHKVKALARQHKVVECQHGHLRAKVRAADADVDDVGDVVILAHGLRIDQHGTLHRVHLR